MSSEHLTRKELKTDQFALTLGSAADYVGLHRRQAIQIAAAVLLVVIAGTGLYFWMDHNRAVREEKLAQAMQTSDATIGPANQQGGLTYPTQAAKDAAVTKAFSDIAAQYHGTNEGAIAEYTLAGVAASAGRDDEARKRYQSVVDDGSKEYASFAKLALAQLDFSDNKAADGEKLLRNLIDHPTTVVSKEQATITLARLISKTRPDDARKLLQPLVKETDESGKLAQAALADLPAK